MRQTRFVSLLYFAGVILITNEVAAQDSPKELHMSNFALERCVTPNGESGRCSKISSCLLGLRHFAKLPDYFCLTESSLIGICCPDNQIVPGLSDRIEVGNSTEDRLGEQAAPVECGRSAVGAGHWPWVAALLKDDMDHFCGGALITPRHVLTAAHCVQPHPVQTLKVRLGEYDLDADDETRAVELRVAACVLHERYDRTTYENDIALLLLRGRAPFSTYVAPLCLPPADRLYENDTAVVAGWGTLGFGGPASFVLLDVSVPVWPLSDCIPLFAQPILDTNLCAGAYEGGKDSCQGDSGGPLMIQESDGRWVAAGIVSWGIGCGNILSPGVYTRVSAYLAWIQRNSNL